MLPARTVAGVHRDLPAGMRFAFSLAFNWRLLMESNNGEAGVERINLGNEEQLRRWAERLDATPDQLREAVAAVGDHPDDVEMHLKGSRSSTNSDRVRDLS
jgi:hypothetical protein